MILANQEPVLLVQVVERGVQMVGSESNCTWAKTRGDFSLSSLSSFYCFLFNFSPALYDLNACNRLTNK